jgi:hypothetical protein
MGSHICYKLFMEKITSVLACKHAAMQKMGGKSYKKSKQWNSPFFLGFSVKSCIFLSLFAFAHAFSYVIVDCMARIVLQSY